MRSQTYRCPVCKDTKTITAHPSQSTREFEEDLPEELGCSTCWLRGTTDNYMERI